MGIKREKQILWSCYFANIDIPKTGMNINCELDFSFFKFNCGVRLGGCSINSNMNNEHNLNKDICFTAYSLFSFYMPHVVAEVR